MTQTVSLPAPNQRLLIVGRTGSGKTVAGLFHLSNTNFDEKPWIVIDFKGDENINAIRGLKRIRWDTDISKLKPGIYALSLMVDQQKELEAFLWNAYYTQNIGLFADEGYMIGQGSRYSPAFRTILTQGRSKNIGVIINSQRPVWLDVFSKSEANKMQIFHLNAAGDRKSMAEYIGDKAGPDVQERLAPYHSIYYDVDSNTAIELSPVPPPAESIALIEARLDLMAQQENLQTVSPRKVRKV